MLEKIIKIAEKTHKPILDIYNSDDFDIELKGDNSPLTKADMKSNEIITKSLREAFPDIPIISEEDKELEYDYRKNFTKFFLVDPLDGTKEFIKKNGEFTVNIALIEDNYPVLGVISAPVLDIIYYGSINNGAFKKENNSIIKINVSDKDDSGLITVQSRSHSGDSEKEFYSKFKIKDSMSRGSSLKFCMVAEGKAHLYYRSGPTMEWDTAAGQAIVEAAGGKVYQFEKRMKYNKEILKNEGFVVSSFDLYE